MKALVRSLLDVVQRIEAFKWPFDPANDVDAICYSNCELTELAVKLKTIESLLTQTTLRPAIAELARIELDDFRAGVELRAKLSGIAALVRSVIEDRGEDPTMWPSAPSQSGEGTGTEQNAEVAALHVEIAELTARVAVLEKQLEEPHPRRRGSYQRVILAMASNRYGYRPDKNNSAAKRISEDAGDRRLRISEDAVRNMLVEAVDDLDCRAELSEAPKDGAN